MIFGLRGCETRCSRASWQFIQPAWKFLVRLGFRAKYSSEGAKVAVLHHPLAISDAIHELGPMTAFVLETARLRMRSFRPEDLEDLVRLCSDAEAMRYLPPYFRPEPREETVARLQRYMDHEAQYGCAFYHVSTLDGVFVGRAGYYWIPEVDMFELGYSLLPDHWGKGYATELTQSLIRHAFGALGWKILCGRTMPAHRVSRRVLEKTGFQYIRPLLFETRGVSFEVAYYELPAPQAHDGPA
jgi:[ribosomal protein S5]-alanine N-acetyltransferase